VSAALLNYKVQKKNKQSSLMSDSAKVLTIRGRSFSKKSKGNSDRSKSRPGFRDLCTFCKELGHWKDCLKIKDKNKESKTEANLARVINTQSDSTSQACGSDSNSLAFSFSVTATIGYLDDSEWMLDT